MPIYEYECEACGHRFELIQKYADLPVEVCPSCGERKVHKRISSPAFQFKGTGWYVTDYARKGTGTAEAQDKAASQDGKDGKGKESKEAKDTKEAKDSKDTKDTKDARDPKAAKSASSDSGTSASSSGSTGPASATPSSKDS